jgi:hypothetical protein
LTNRAIFPATASYWPDRCTHVLAVTAVAEHALVKAAVSVSAAVAVKHQPPASER